MNSLLILGNVYDNTAKYVGELLTQGIKVGIISSVFHKYPEELFEDWIQSSDFDYVIVTEQLHEDIVSGIEDNIIYVFENAARFYENILLINISDKIKQRVEQVAFDRKMTILSNECLID
jgi:hypothetical protein